MFPRALNVRVGVFYYGGTPSRYGGNILLLTDAQDVILRLLGMLRSLQKGVATRHPH